MTTQERWLESYPFLTPRAGINKSNLYGVARAAIWSRVSNIAAVTEAASIPDEDLQPIALRVAEQEQVPAQGLARQSIPDQTVQPFEPLAPVGDPGGQIDPCGWTQSKHRLHPLPYTHQALERTRIKIRMHLDPAPARQHYCQPTSRVVLRPRFLGGQLHLHQLAGRRNWPTPSSPTPFLQMAIQRTEA